MPIADPAAAAKALYEARQTRVPIAPFTDTDPGLGMSDGYEVQQHLVRMLTDDGEKIVGYKVGLTSKPMQRLIGVDSPDYGPVFGSTLYASGDAGPASRSPSTNTISASIFGWMNRPSGTASPLAYRVEPNTGP